MKIIVCATLCLAMPILWSCQKGYGAKSKLKIEVISDMGTPVEGAGVFAQYAAGLVTNPGGGFPTDRMKTLNATTDARGQAILEYRTSSEPEGLIWVSKDRFYTSVHHIESWTRPATASKGSQPAVVLKPIKNPVAMFARSNIGDSRRYSSIPELNKEYGYDLKLGEALPPLGNGKTADFHFSVTGHYRDMNSSNLTLSLRFANPQDGLVEFITPQRGDPREAGFRGSEYVSDYLAPETGYVNGLTRSDEVFNEGRSRHTDVDLKRNFYFRTRTKTAPDGSIISANYGKIYGDFDFSSGNLGRGTYANFLVFVSYFNPVENDRNVEFDVKKNLLPGGNVGKP